MVSTWFWYIGEFFFMERVVNNITKLTFFIINAPKSNLVALLYHVFFFFFFIFVILPESFFVLRGDYQILIVLFYKDFDGSL